MKPKLNITKKGGSEDAFNVICEKIERCLVRSSLVLLLAASLFKLLRLEAGSLVKPMPEDSGFAATSKPAMVVPFATSDQNSYLLNNFAPANFESHN